MQGLQWTTALLQWCPVDSEPIPVEKPLLSSSGKVWVAISIISTCLMVLWNREPWLVQLGWLRMFGYLLAGCLSLASGVLLVVAICLSKNPKWRNRPGFENFWIVALSAAILSASGPAVITARWVDNMLTYSDARDIIRALDAYHSSHGEYPRGLEMLEPEYLPEIPLPQVGEAEVEVQVLDRDPTHRTHFSFAQWVGVHVELDVAGAQHVGLSLGRVTDLHALEADGSRGRVDLRVAKLKPAPDEARHHALDQTS